MERAERIQRSTVLRLHGWEGIGVLGEVREQIANSPTRSIADADLETLAFEMHLKAESLRAIINSCVEIGVLARDKGGIIDTALMIVKPKRTRKRTVLIKLVEPGRETEVQKVEVNSAEEEAPQPLKAKPEPLPTSRVAAPPKALRDPSELVFPIECTDEECKNVWEEWIVYRRKKRCSYAGPQYEQYGLNKASEHGRDALLWAIKHSMSNGYTGLFPEKYPGLRTRKDFAAERLDARKQRESEAVSRLEDRYGSNPLIGIPDGEFGSEEEGANESDEEDT